MSGTVSEDARVRPELSELLDPALGDAPPILVIGGRPTPPWQVVYHYAFGDWELFIREWATKVRDDYVQVKRMGGANDHGVDVAAFKSTAGFEGSWDCFQGKHYARPLTEGDALTEIFKVFLSAVRGHYVLPDNYRFLSPQGCSGALEKLLSSPSKLKQSLLSKLVVGSKLVGGVDPQELEAVSALVTATSFEMFASVQFEDMLATHRQTHYYAIRFGGPLNDRPMGEPAPQDTRIEESRYVEQLVAVYAEKYPHINVSAATVANHPHEAGHFQRQRVLFYQAEALRKFAESSVPSGTYEFLQEDVYQGVVEDAGRAYPSGFERLSSVLTVSVALNLSRHVLMTVADLGDVKGICHQLANNSRLFWDRESQ